MAQEPAGSPLGPSVGRLRAVRGSVSLVRKALVMALGPVVLSLRLAFLSVARWVT